MYSCKSFNLTEGLLIITEYDTSITASSSAPPLSPIGTTNGEVTSVGNEVISSGYKTSTLSKVLLPSVDCVNTAN